MSAASPTKSWTAKWKFSPPATGKNFPDGVQNYSVHASAAASLPPGHFQLTKTGNHLRLEWNADEKHGVGPVVREATHQMKLPPSISKARRAAGILLVECLVYIAVFAILLGGGMAAFYFCWDHSRALIYATNDIESALRAGERWRADVRARDRKNFRRNHGGRRNGADSRRRTRKSFTVSTPAKCAAKFRHQKIPELLLPKVKASQMSRPARRRDRVALGTGTGAAPQGNASAAAVHL